MNIMPIKYSLDTVFLNGVEDWRKSENGFKKEVLPRMVALAAYPPILAIALLYNALAFGLKIPLCLARYTIGLIPTEQGLLMAFFPKSTSAGHLAWHAYKVFLFWVDVPLYPLAIALPGANIWVHRKLCLICLDSQGGQINNPKEQNINPIEGRAIPVSKTNKSTPIANVIKEINSTPKPEKRSQSRRAASVPVTRREEEIATLASILNRRISLNQSSPSTIAMKIEEIRDESEWEDDDDGKDIINYVTSNRSDDIGSLMNPVRDTPAVYTPPQNRTPVKVVPDIAVSVVLDRRKAIGEWSDDEEEVDWDL
jgi:hypothetical protein